MSMKKAFILSLVASLCLANVYIKTQGDVIYTIDGQTSTKTEVKDGSTIKFESGNGKLFLTDTVSNQDIELSKPGQSHTAEVAQTIFGEIKAFFTAKVEVEQKGAFTRGGDCLVFKISIDTLPINQNAHTLKYYQKDKLVYTCKVDECFTQKKIKSKSGDIIRILDKDGYDIYCLRIEK